MNRRQQSALADLLRSAIREISYQTLYAGRELDELEIEESAATLYRLVEEIVVGRESCHVDCG